MADALEHWVRAVAAGEIFSALACFVAALLDDVGGAELACDPSKNRLKVEGQRYANDYLADANRSLREAL